MRVAFIGGMHSGKTAAVNHFFALSKKAKCAGVIVKFAKPLYAAQKCFTPEGVKHRSFLQGLSDLAKTCFGPQILNQLFIEELAKSEKLGGRLRYYKGVDVFCDDVRTSSEFQVVKEHFFITIGIKADEKARRQRNPGLFTGLSHCTETEIDQLLSKCDILIKNNGTLEEFKKKLDGAWK